MSRTYQVLLAAVVAIAAVGGYWKLVLSPKREQAAQLSVQLAAQQAQLAQTQQLIATYSGAKVDYKANYDKVVRLGKAVPADDDTRSLVVQLDSAAKRSGIDFNTINLNGSGASSSSDGAKSTAPGAISAGTFSAMPFAFSFTGEYGSLGNFLSRLENFVALKGDNIAVNGRLLRVESITLAPGDAGWPTLSARIGASSYIVPEAADPAAAGGANASVSTTTSPGTTSASTTSTTSTATATDLR